MTLGDIIDRADRLRYNAFSREEKLGWLLQLEHTVKRNILDTHEGGLPCSQPAEDAPTLAPEGFAEMYLKWPEAQIDLYSGELERYNASISLFNTEYAAFESWYNRTYSPKGAGSFRW